MIGLDEITRARDELLERMVTYFSEPSEVLGILLGGSIPSGTADSYSDIDLRIIATPEHHAHLVANRLSTPTEWDGWLFNEWLEETEHCVSHFRPFFKVDVFYWRYDRLVPSPWYKLPTEVLLDRTGVVQRFLDESKQLEFQPVDAREASRVISKAIACAHEVLRRARRGELFYAHTLLEKLRSYLILMEDWISSFSPTCAADLKLQNRLSTRLGGALKQSYVNLDSYELEAAVIHLCELLLLQVPELHTTFSLDRPIANDLHAIKLIASRQIA